MQFFEDLPPGRNIRQEPVDWASAYDAMMQNPGQWGLIASDVSASTPGQLRAGKNQHFRGDDLKHFEFRVRKPENPDPAYGKRRTDLYGRYVPEGVN